MLISNRANTVLLVLILAVGIGIVAMLASGARGGPLDPPNPPASTMHTLDEVYTTANNVPQSWDRKLDSTNGSIGGPLLPAGCNSDRFACVFWRKINLVTSDYDGVLDRETGLVWQRVPNTSGATWSDAMDACENAYTGGRGGWRLPTAAELLSLRDNTVVTYPMLPAGSPFVVNAALNFFWTSTLASYTGGTQLVEVVDLSIVFAASDTPSSGRNFWCVRGPTSNR